MSQKDHVVVPISFEALMRSLFGDKYYRYVGEISKTTWKKDLRKIAKYIKKSIELNVDTDQYHREHLLKLCEMLDKELESSKTTAQMNVITIEKLVKLIFYLLGNLPENWNMKSPYADRFWELDGHRRLLYVQSDEQKSYLLLNLIDIKKLFKIDLEDYDDLHEIFYTKFKSKAAEFIVWFKNTYPEIYCAIF